MARDAQARLAGIIRQLSENAGARIVPRQNGGYDLATGGYRPARLSEETVGWLQTRGLIEEREPGQYAASDVARNWIRRQAGGDEAFRAQHDALARTCAPGEDRTVLTNLDESPIATLARRPGKDGKPFLSPDLVVAAERLRRDFEIGRLQPRVTANWSASVNRGRRTGEAGGTGDLTDTALAARRRVERAVEAVGPELSGVLIDVCCFLKGLETVERERQWPARSAKLVLRIALQILARSYGLMPFGTGGAKARGKLRHWGTENYRPAIS